MWALFGLGLLIGFGWGMFEERRKNGKEELRLPQLYFWDCKFCIYNIQMRDEEAMNKRMERHLKWHLTEEQKKRA